MIGDARTKSRGQFLREKEFRVLRESAAAAMPIVRAVGVSVMRTGSGTLMSFPQTGTRFAFAFSTTGTHVACKLAIDTGVRFAVSQDDNAFLSVRMAPGYRASHFEQHLIEEGLTQPEEIDQFCVIENGMIRPDYRFHVVDPVDVSELCTPPEPSPAAAGSPPETPCAPCDEAALTGTPSPSGCGCNN